MDDHMHHAHALVKVFMQVFVAGYMWMSG